MNHLFNIGDNIVYPMQGVGLIENIEEKNISGESQQYCMINISSKKMNVMMPLSKMLASGIRLIVDEATLDKALLVLNDKNLYTSQSLSYKERYQANMNKVRTGVISDGIEVIHDLTIINSEKTLNTTEKQLLNSARKILVDEIALIKGVTETQANNFLSFSIN
ncbi:MAG: CarD family transcriptional regulator [Clostridiaceae bacterium]